MEHRLWTGLVITLVLGCAPPPSADRDRTGGAQDAGARLTDATLAGGERRHEPFMRLDQHRSC